LLVGAVLEAGDKRHFVQIAPFERAEETVQLCPHETIDCEW
jgi:hypothetical protein